jgi:hypothetical protein
MQPPQLKPLDWVVFEIEQDFYFGQIVGGYRDIEDKGWQYIITNPQNAAGINFTVPVTDIKYHLQKGEWVGPKDL